MTRAPETTIPSVISTYLARRGIAEARTVPLAGDASDRRYYRVRPAGDPPFVIALHAAPFESESLPFLNVAALFEAMGIPIPRVVDQAADLGVLALEDLGDVTLQARLTAASDDQREQFYGRAVDLIRRIQTQGRRQDPTRFVPYGLAFDLDKLMWEMRFFLEHFLVAWRKASLSGSEQTALEAELETLVAELAAEPRVLCHRDYHSRNLMVRGRQLYVIDFQDARMGPDTYDLASLLRDSYVDLPAELVESLLDTFARGTGRAEEPGEFRRRFDLMALQRNLKALGTFGYQATSRSNPAYANYVPRTLVHVRENLVRHDRFGRLRDMLAGHLPELR